MKKLAVVIIALFAGAVAAGTIKSWSNAEALTASDLNANFTHLHGLMVGSHGARLVNADVSASAAIATTKLAANLLIPKTWVTLPYTGAATGVGEFSGGSATVAHTSPGVYTVTLGYTATNNVYGVVTTPHTNGAITGTCEVTTSVSTTTVFVVTCLNNAGAATDMGFTAVVYDND